MTTLDEIINQVKISENIVILTHENPDGDAVGSSLAMKLLIEKLDKKADVIIPKYSKTFDFLPEIDKVKINSEIEHYDLAITVDCGDIKRIEAREYFDKAKKTIVIDHHGSNNMYGDINFVNPASSSCCEIIAGIADSMDIEISKEIGECLVTGIITDTGGFRHEGITAETFEFTADLIRKGVNIPVIYKKVLRTKTKATFELSKRVTDRLEFYENERVAFSYMLESDESEVKAEEGDHEGLVEIAREIEGVDVSIFLRENIQKGGFKISLRSSNVINVSNVCKNFNGGGHPRAAGGFIESNLEEAKKQIVEEVIKQLDSEKEKDYGWNNNYRQT